MRINVFYILSFLTLAIFAEGAYVLLSHGRPDTPLELGVTTTPPLPLPMSNDPLSVAGAATTSSPASNVPPSSSVSKPNVSPPPPPAAVQSISTDTVAPSTPEGISATVISDSQINVGWSAARDNIGVTGYYLYRNGVKIASTASFKYA